jgi:hypothetical protein
MAERVKNNVSPAATHNVDVDDEICPEPKPEVYGRVSPSEVDIDNPRARPLPSSKTPTKPWTSWRTQAMNLFERLSEKGSQTHQFFSHHLEKPIYPGDHVPEPCYPDMRNEGTSLASEYKSALSSSTYYTAVSQLSGRVKKSLPRQIQE